MNKMMETVKGVGSMTVGAAVLTVHGTKKSFAAKALLVGGAACTVMGIISSTTVATVVGVGAVGAAVVVGFKAGIDDVSAGIDDAIKEAAVVQ